MKKRQPTRLHGYDYSRPGAYFVTICTHQKVNLLGRIQDSEMILNQAGQIAMIWWRLLPYRYPNISLDEFIVMPDHIHGILHIQQDLSIDVGEIHEFPLQDVEGMESSDLEDTHTLDTRIGRRRMLLPMAIGFFKMNTAKAINQFLGTQGQSIWQRSYYEHIIRGEGGLNRVREYILNNPLQDNYDLGADLE